MATRRIQWRLFAAFLALSVAVTVPAALLLDRWLGADVRALVRDSLAREATVLASELDRALPPDLPAWVHRLESPTAARVTVIALDGTVRADSDVGVEDLVRMENHRSRAEVRAALSGGVGSDARRSATLGRELMYVAVPIGAPPRLVLRLALPLDQLDQTVGQAQAAVWLSGLIALVLALLFGYVLAQRLSRPILAMTRAARAMSRGDFGATLPPPSGDELGELGRALESLRDQLAARIAQLRNEGTKVRTILNSMSEGVALVQGGAITLANPAFATLLGTARTVEGRAPLEAARVPELAEIVETATVARAGAAREVQLGGRALMLEAHPLGDTQAVVVVFDMTEQRRLERLRRDFVANASHELRTPAAAIAAVAETLSAGAGEDPEARRSFLDILLRHANRLSGLISDLLDIARLEGGYRPRIESVDVSSVVENVVAALLPQAARKQIDVQGAAPAGLTLAAERAAVEQILTNLVDNAIKYTAEGGRVRVLANEREELVDLVVEDTGAGIPAEHLPRLFERFYRVDDARSRELGGTGLGLAIVKHLALANGGQIRVESEVGKGSRFIVSLPRL